MTKHTNPRLLLAKLRQGDYAHPGSTDAIDLVLETLLKHCPSGKLNILDAGCGRGGTAAYVKNKINADVQAFDLDSDAIHYASQTYPQVTFFKCDISETSKHVKGTFDAICLFNVYYALSEQQASLQELARVSKPGTVLAIFDYVNLNE